jgi:predicted ATPase
MEALHGSVPVALGGARQRALLAILLLHANRPVSTDSLIDLLWGTRPPPSVAKVVQVYVSQLRKALEHVDDEGVTRRGIVTTPGGYGVEVATDEYDALLFESLVARGRRARDAGDNERAVHLLTEALALWRGPALADFASEGFATPEIARLEDMRLSAVEARIEAELALGRHSELTGELEVLLSRHPARESLTRLLMLALYRSGRQSEALDRFQATRRYLVDELGLEPSLELRDLQEKVLAHDASLRWRPRHRNPHNLPSPATSFVGRDHDLTQLRAVLERRRLVTLTGPGGSGKSRLAVELARSLADGVDLMHLVELTEIRTEAEVLAAIASLLGESEGIEADLVRVIGSAVQDREVVLILDNAEHVVAAVADVVRRLLAACPRLRFVVTSREVLAIPEEHAYLVGPLSAAPAFQLFAERAEAVSPGLRVDKESDGHVEEIVRRLDGLPLALELAAALVRAMSPAQIADRLDGHLSLLRSDAGSPSTAPSRRPRTLWDMVAWSFSLLDEEERRVLRGLSVFPSAFSLGAAEAACGEGALGVLTRLVRKSMLYAEDWSGDKRYRLMETVRAFAGDELDAAGETADWQTRHAAYFLALAEEAQPHLKSSGQRTWLEALVREEDNLRAALASFVSGDDHLNETRLTAALWRPSYLSGHYSSCRGWLEAALKHEDVPAATRAEALYGAGALALYQCDYPAAAAHLGSAHELYLELADEHGRAGVLTLLGSIAREQGDYAEAMTLHGVAEELCESLGDRWGVAQALELSSFASWLDTDFDSAWALAERALREARVVGDEERIGWCRLDLAAVSHYLDDAEEAQSHLEGALASFQALGFKEGSAWAHNLLGLVHASARRHDDAVDALTQSLRLHRELSDCWRLGSVLEALAGALVQVGQHDEAAVLLGVTQRVRADFGTPVPPCERPAYDATVAVVDASLDPAALARAARRAGALSLDDACTRVLAVLRPRV